NPARGSAAEHRRLSLYSHGAHRDQHSFPTRRSSDLLPLLPGERLVGDPAHQVLEEPVLPALRRPWIGLDRQDLLAHQRRQHGLQDRKSTRLNSSHVAISYAVFCLKKRNLKQRTS